MSALGRRGGPRWTLFLGAALLLHAASFLGLRQRHSNPDRVLVPVLPQAENEIEIENLAPAPIAESAESTPEPPLRANSAPPSAESTPVATPSPAAHAINVPESAAIEAAPLVESPAEAPRRPLSLAELGVGANNPFATGPGAPVPSPEAPRESARVVGRKRFQRALATEIALADHTAGLGPEGPVLSAVERAARSDNPELNSQALFDFSTDSTGKLVQVDLVSSSSDPTPWRRIGEATRRALASTLLKLPKTGYGITFRVRVIARVEMPSGADPGLAVNLAGIPLKKGRGPRSARIDILNVVPGVSETNVRLPSGQDVSVPEVRVGSLLSAMGDLSDIGAKAALSVRAHVERLTLNER
jgi:hypothetical protein